MRTRFVWNPMRWRIGNGTLFVLASATLLALAHVRVGLSWGVVAIVLSVGYLTAGLYGASDPS